MAVRSRAKPHDRSFERGALSLSTRSSLTLADRHARGATLMRDRGLVGRPGAALRRLTGHDDVFGRVGRDARRALARASRDISERRRASLGKQSMAISSPRCRPLGRHRLNEGVARQAASIGPSASVTPCWVEARSVGLQCSAQPRCSAHAYAHCCSAAPRPSSLRLSSTCVCLLDLQGVTGCEKQAPREVRKKRGTKARELRVYTFAPLVKGLSRHRVCLLVASCRQRSEVRVHSSAAV